MSGHNAPALLAMCQVSYRLGQLVEVVQWKGDRMEPQQQPEPAAAAVVQSQTAGTKFMAADDVGEPPAPIPPKLSDKERTLLATRTKAFYVAYRALAAACGVDIFAAWTAKMVKVRRKYPAELCRGRADKYTAYVERIAAKEEVVRARESGHLEAEPMAKRQRTEEVQVQEGTSNIDSQGPAPTSSPEPSTRDSSDAPANSTVGPAAPSPANVLDSRHQLRELVRARDWAQFHTPRNLLLALTGEVGEVAEEVQKLDSAEVSEAQRHTVGEELADCWSYLVRFCDASGLPLEEFVA